METWLQDHAGEYVRLIGIDQGAKRRVVEVIIQRPGDTPGSPSRGTTTTRHLNSSNSRSYTASNGNLAGDSSNQLRALLHQGYKIGLEHANARRYKTNSWLTGETISSSREGEALQELNRFLADHAGEYVRIIGIDANAKRRVAEIVVQRPDSNETGKKSNTTAAPSSYKSVSTTSSSGSGGGGLTPEVVETIRGLLANGYSIGTEHTDKRRFKAKSWDTCPTIDGGRESEVLAKLESCLADHAGEYVRIIGIDRAAKRRVLEQIIQRPGDNASGGRASLGSTSAGGNVSASNSYGAGNGGGYSNSAVRLDNSVVTQVRSLLAQGYKISTEHTDKRRFKAKSWKSCAPITSTHESEVLRALEGCLADHNGEYVRLLGIDPAAKRRVLETIIQRP